jgi:hypothetical protein
MNITTQLTSNQFYAGINRRFDRRAALLRKSGFSYRAVCPGVAVFTRVRYGKETNVAAATVLHADKRVWTDTLETALIR